MPEHDNSAGRARQNHAERAFEQLALQAGWEPTKRGWPDFWCRGPSGELIAVEVKPRRTNGRLGYLKAEQAEILDALAGHGIRCFVSDGYVLEPYRRAQHAR